MERFLELDPVDDHDRIMATVAQVVCANLPDYRGRVSLTFVDVPHPDDPTASWRGNVLVRPDDPVDPAMAFDHFKFAGAAGLEIGLAAEEGWLDYDGDLILRLHDLGQDDSMTVQLASGCAVVIEFGDALVRS